MKKRKKKKKTWLSQKRRRDAAHLSLIVSFLYSFEYYIDNQSNVLLKYCFTLFIRYNFVRVIIKYLRVGRTGLALTEYAGIFLSILDDFWKKYARFEKICS